MSRGPKRLRLILLDKGLLDLEAPFWLGQNQTIVSRGSVMGANSAIYLSGVRGGSWGGGLDNQRDVWPTSACSSSPGARIVAASGTLSPPLLLLSNRHSFVAR